MAVPVARARRLPRSRSAALIERYERELGGAGIDYQLLDTSTAARARAAGVSVDARQVDGTRWSVAELPLAALPARRARASPCRSCCTCSSASRPRVKFAAVQLLRKRAGRAHRRRAGCANCCCWRCASPRCAAGARVRAAVRRAARAVDDAASPSSRSTRRSACRRRAGSSARGSWRSRRSTQAPAGDLVGVVTFADGARRGRRAEPDRGAAPRRHRHGAAAGIRRARATAPRCRRRRDASRRRGAGTVVVVTDLQESGWDAGDRASVPERRDDRGGRRRRAAGEPRGDGRARRWPIASSRRCATTAAGRARRTCVLLRRRSIGRPATRVRSRSAPDQSVRGDVRRGRRRARRGARSTVDDPARHPGRQRPLSPCSTTPAAATCSS